MSFIVLDSANVVKSFRICGLQFELIPGWGHRVLPRRVEIVKSSQATSS